MLLGEGLTPDGVAEVDSLKIARLSVLLKKHLKPKGVMRARL